MTHYSTRAPNPFQDPPIYELYELSDLVKKRARLLETRSTEDAIRQALADRQQSRRFHPDLLAYAKWLAIYKCEFTDYGVVLKRELLFEEERRR